MAISITNAQGTKAYLVATTAATGTASEIKTAATAGKAIGCVQNIGDITSSRSVQEYKCLSSDEVAKSLGSISLPNISTELLFDAADATGQADLRLMYSTNTRRKMIIELNDQITPTTGNPTYIVFECALSSDGLGINIDAAVLYKTTVEITSKPVLTKAT